MICYLHDNLKINFHNPFKFIYNQFITIIKVCASQDFSRSDAKLSVENAIRI